MDVCAFALILARKIWLCEQEEPNQHKAQWNWMYIELWSIESVLFRPFSLQINRISSQITARNKGEHSPKWEKRTHQSWRKRLVKWIGVFVLFWPWKMKEIGEREEEWMSETKDQRKSYDDRTEWQAKESEEENRTHCGMSLLIEYD